MACSFARIRSRRDFLWIDDAVDGLVAIALGQADGIFDLGTGTSLSAGDVARRALALAGEGDRTVISEIESPPDDDVVMLDVMPIRARFG